MYGEMMAKSPTLIGIFPIYRGTCIALGGNVSKNTESFGSIQNLQQNFFRLIEGEFASVSACRRGRDLEISSATSLLLLPWWVIDGAELSPSWCIAAGDILQEK